MISAIALNKMIDAGKTDFQRSIAEQIAVNRARTPTERFAALCNLLDAARAMAPRDAEARRRRQRALAARQHERERWREQCARLLTTGRADPAPRL
jgi:hypothetical protein